MQILNPGGWEVRYLILGAPIAARGPHENAKVFRLVSCIKRTNPPPRRNVKVTSAGVLADSNPSPMAKNAMSGVLITNTDRKPTFFNAQVVRVFIRRLPAAYAKTNIPDANGLTPNPA